MSVTHPYHAESDSFKTIKRPYFISPPLSTPHFGRSRDSHHAQPIDLGSALTTHKKKSTMNGRPLIH